MLRSLWCVVLVSAALPARAQSADVFSRFDAWAERYQRAQEGSPRQALLEEGLGLAQQRRGELSRLMRTAPSLAFSLCRSPEGLPAPIAALVERRLVGQGRLEVLGVCFGDGPQRQERAVVLGAQRYLLGEDPSLLGLRTRAAFTVDGYALDGWAALDPRKTPRNAPQPSPFTTGTKKVLYIRVDFSDAPGEPVTEATATASLATVNTYLRAASYNKTGITSTITPVLRVAGTKASYAGNNNTSKLLNDARAAANAAGFATSTYDLDIVAFSRVPAWGWAGLGFVGAKGTWLNGSFGWGVAAHELGHNYGLFHANFWEAPGQTIIGSGSSLEYGNPNEVMGDGDGHHNAWYKSDLDWFGSTEVERVQSSGSFQVFDLEQPITGGLHALRVPISAARDYWVEYRPAASALSARGVVVIWGFPGSQASQLLDMRPATSTANDAVLTEGRTFSDLTAGIHLTPTGKGNGSPQSMNVVVNRGLFPGNQPPTVTLQASATQANVGQVVTLTATASDPNGDALAYDWDFGDQSASTNAATQAKAWTSVREALVQVTVSDMKGGTARASVLVRVGNPATLKLSGKVLSGTVGVEGVRIQAGALTTFTDTSGAWTLVGIASGSFNVTAAKAGWTFQASFPTPVSVSGASVANLDFAAFQVTYSVSGRVTSLGVGLPGITITAAPYSTTTDASGNYALTGVPNGAYVLEATGVPGQLFAVQGFSNPIQVNGASLQGRNFFERVYAVSGEVTGEPGPHTISNGPRSTTTALMNGAWRYTLALPVGDWNLEATKPGTTITPWPRRVSVVAANVSGVDFVAAAGASSSIRGFVDELGSGALGVDVSDGTRSSRTDSAGFYVLGGVPDGAFTVTPAKPGTLFAPASQAVTVAGAPLAGVDFVVTNANAPPSIVVSPLATPSPVVGTTTELVVLGDDAVEGEQALTYVWRQLFGPAPATFSRNGDNGAKQTTATFTRAGAYLFEVDVVDGGGLKKTAGLSVVVVQTPTAVVVTPATAMVEVGGDRQFLAAVTDQFGTVLDSSGTATWTVSGGGTLTPTGRFYAETAGSHTVTATVGNAMGSATVTVVVGPVPRVVTPPTASPNPTPTGSAALTVLGADDGGEDKLTYTWSALDPVAAVTFTPNGTNAAKASVAGFSAPGNYNLKVDVTDERGLTANAFLTVVVSERALAGVAVSPADKTVPTGGTVQFTAAGKDQFGGALPAGSCTFSVKAACAGTIDAAGLFTAGTSAGTCAVLATCGAFVSPEVTVTVSTEGAGGGGSGEKPKGCGCSSDAEGSPALLLLAGFGALVLRRRGARRSFRSSPALPNLFSQWRRSAGAALVVALAACTEVPSQPFRPATPSATAGTASKSQELGEVENGYPADQERMLHLYINLIRHSATTPDTNACGDFTGDPTFATRQKPLVYNKALNVAARFSGKHMAESGCFQFDNCCVLGDAGVGPGCLAPAACTGSNCQKTCDAGTGQTAQDRYNLFGANSYAGSSIALQKVSAYDVWCAWLMSESNRNAMRGADITEFGGGNSIGSSQSCNSSYWAAAYGRPATAPPIPRIPVATALYPPPNPLTAPSLQFAASYYDSTDAPPVRSFVVVDGHCFDLEKAFGTAGNGTYQVGFPDPDQLPDGCHQYYFVFNDAAGARAIYPSTGSFNVALGAGQQCPLAYDPSPPLPADCETGVQTCPEGAERTCYTADPLTLASGECRQGYQVCRRGFWSSCRDMVAPFPEACDGLDNDCDGQVDENNPGGNASCEVFGERGVCKAGTRVCTSGRQTCIGTQQPSPEVCNGLDDDCDGVADDGFSIATCGVGECFRITQACLNGVASACVPGAPAPEVEDRKDNDCDGIIDNGFDCRLPDAGGIGALRRLTPATFRLLDGGLYPATLPCGLEGTQRCQEDAGWSALLGGTLPRAEVCNGTDDDCNGRSDIEDINAIGYERCGAGACLVITPSCFGTTPEVCTPKAASAELCDGLDNSCDGRLDEGCNCRQGEERPCYTGPQVTRDAGVCRGGKRSCVDGGYTRCQGQVLPSQELCDGLDNDCDGVVDDLCLAVDGGFDAGTGGGAGGGAGGAGGGDAADSGAGGGAQPPKGCGCGGAPGGLLALLALGLLRRRAV